jgi:hypothetical protein
VEEMPGQFLVVMLTGVHEDTCKLSIVAEKFQERRHFHKIGPSTDDAYQFVSSHYGWPGQSTEGGGLLTEG